VPWSLHVPVGVFFLTKIQLDLSQKKIKISLTTLLPYGTFGFRVFIGSSSERGVVDCFYEHIHVITSFFYLTRHYFAY
jgi:hypothetical protein